MYSPFLSLLFMGALPFPGDTVQNTSILEHVRVAPPVMTASAGTGGLVVRDFPLRLSASGVLVIDSRSGQSLLAKDAQVPRPVASIAKLMTALLIVEHHAMDEWVTIPPEAQGTAGENIRLRAGQQFSVSNLLSAMLIGSANDAAVALAVHHSSSTEAFASAMNTRARELGLLRTSYQNPVGFDAEEQWSTPQDVAWLTMFALRSEEIRRRMGMRGATIRSRTGDAVTVTNTNALLHAESGVIAGKTGTTPAARQCLVSVVAGSDGREYIVVLLRSINRYADMRALVRALTS